jgi:hypothetical protein
VLLVHFARVLLRAKRSITRGSAAQAPPSGTPGEALRRAELPRKPRALLPPHSSRRDPDQPNNLTAPIRTRHPSPTPSRPPGEQLNQLSGIAAVLRFPLPELEDQELVEEA